MTTIDKLVQKVQDNMGERQEVALDPATLTVITSVVIETLKLVNSCVQSAEEAAKIVHSPTDDNITKLKAVIRQQLGWWNNWWYGAKYLQALLITGTQLTLADLKKSLKDIKNTNGT